MSDKSHSAVNNLIDQAVNRVVQTIDTSIVQAVIQGAKLAAGQNGSPSGEVTPIIGALACDFDAFIAPKMEAIRQDLHEAAALRLLHRADRLDRHEGASPAPKQKPLDIPVPVVPPNEEPKKDHKQNGKPKDGKPLNFKSHATKPDIIELKGGLG